MALVQGQKCALDRVSNCLPYLKTTCLPTPTTTPAGCGKRATGCNTNLLKTKNKDSFFLYVSCSRDILQNNLKIWGVQSSSLPTLSSSMSSMTVKTSNSHRTRRILHFINFCPLDDPIWLPTIGRNLHSQSSGYFHRENKATSPPEQLVTTHQTTRCHFSEHHDLNLHRRMNLKSQIKISSLSKLLRPFYLMRSCLYLGVNNSATNRS